MSRAEFISVVKRKPQYVCKYKVAKFCNDDTSQGRRFGTGVTAQFAVFGTLALQLKRRAPKAHTVVELARRRWGHKANFVSS